ncbi:hypothetical protein SUFG_00067 [Sulfitobacter phage phiCB2047-B]|uniref:Uncharacterized protein n=1 Tax=Sulfitobacter phage phiCB2047-B TaxID=754046 RepID=M4PYJ8_9CAUD|nr:hypothetical protein SUFG_00067 [Sulfitobacter phage phiCB2047-B]AGH07434.1 hypothetical protein SUFG_00067 [Sulfitobacter phage phiCB2047-B]
MPTEHGKKVTNTNGYGYFEGKPTPRERKVLSVTFITDMVKGAFFDPSDLMEWICHNPYVDTVTYMGEVPEDNYKVIITDNFDRDHVSDRLFLENLTKDKATLIANAMNGSGDKYSDDFYMAVHEDRVLHTAEF